MGGGDGCLFSKNSVVEWTDFLQTSATLPSYQNNILSVETKPPQFAITQIVCTKAAKIV